MPFPLRKKHINIASIIKIVFFLLRKTKKKGMSADFFDIYSFLCKLISIFALALKEPPFKSKKIALGYWEGEAKVKTIVL